MNWIAEEKSEDDSWFLISGRGNNLGSLDSVRFKSLSKPNFVSNGSVKTPKRQAYSSIADQVQNKLKPVVRLSSNNVAKNHNKKESLKNAVKLN